MKTTTLIDSMTGLSATVILLFWILVPETPIFSMVTVFLTLGTVYIVLRWMTLGIAVDLLWGGAAGAFTIAETLVVTFWLQTGGLVTMLSGFAVIAVSAGVISYFRKDWMAGVQVAWAAWLVSLWGLVILMLVGYRQPWMATIFETMGYIELFRLSAATAFWPWIVADSWNTIVFRALVDGGLGLVAGLLAIGLRRFQSR